MRVCLIQLIQLGLQSRADVTWRFAVCTEELGQEAGDQAAAAFAMLGLLKVFEVYDTVEEAIKSFK